MQPDTPQMPSQAAASSHSSRRFNRLIVPLVLAVLLLLGSLGFGFWAYGQSQDYKNNVDTKVKEQLAAAVAKAEQAKEDEFVEREKQPLKEYKGPSALGSISVKYPKTWSAFVDESDGGTPLDGYFHPGFVPGLESGTAFALHIEVLNEEYAKALEDFDSASKKGEVTVTALNPVNVTGVTGARIDGQISKDKRGSVVLFPLRDKTLRLTTESEQYVKDFNDIILTKIVFTP